MVDLVTISCLKVVIASPQTMPLSSNGRGNVFGLQGGEKLQLGFTDNYSNVDAGLNSGVLQIGFHVQALPNGASDTYISSNGNAGNPPQPLTMLAAGAAVGLVMFKKQHDQSQKAE